MIRERGERRGRGGRRKRKSKQIEEREGRERDRERYREGESREKGRAGTECRLRGKLPAQTLTHHPIFQSNHGICSSREVTGKQGRRRAGEKEMPEILKAIPGTCPCPQKKRGSSVHAAEKGLDSMQSRKDIAIERASEERGLYFQGDIHAQ
jgi:hypothetical protein